jgi:hypothetical protein
MAEQEVIKHTQKVLRTVRSKRKGWKHKLQEILLEIVIIVFAVSLSIYLHNWSEKRHDHHEEVAFLEGLRTDLQNDIKEMEGDRGAYLNVAEGSAYFKRVAFGEPLNQDSLAKHELIFINTTYFSPNISRFEGLKASGKLSVIENKELLDDILNLYQEDIPYLNMLNAFFNTYKTQQLRPILDQRLDLDKDGHGNWEEVLRSREMRNSLKHAEEVEEVISAYAKTIRTANKIIKAIDQELK